MPKPFLLSILRFFSKKIIKKYHPKVVGITGSVGKTSTKEAVFCVLKSKYNVRANYKNYNNEIGVPLTIIGVNHSPGSSLIGWLAVFAKAFKLVLGSDKKYPEILVLEMGADKPGDIAYLTDIAPCTVGVLTSITHAHTEFFKNLQGIAREKRGIINHLSPEGTAILNYDSSIVMEQASHTKAKLFTYGLKAGADFQATDSNLKSSEQGWPLGITFKVAYKGTNSVPVFLNDSVATTIIPAALAALAVGSVFDVNLVDGAQALRHLKPLAGHLRPIEGIKNTLIIDDTYNSSPDAVKAALETICALPSKEGSRTYVVLGDMLELGSETAAAHRDIGFKIAEFGIDFLITVGEASKGTAEAAREAGLSEDQVASFADSISAGRFLQEKLKEGDRVLVKGSQSIRMEKIVKEIMADPLRAKELLVRQEEEWLKR